MRRMATRILALMCLFAMGVGTIAARAQPERAAGPTPPRLAFVNGEVSFWRPGAEDWAPAQVNTALAAGDALYVGDGGNVELQIGARAYVRAGSGTQLGLDTLEIGYMQLEVTAGHCALDLKQLPDGQTIEVDTPQGAFTIERPGYYRVDVDDRTAFITRRGGAASVVPAGGDTTDIAPDQQLVLDGTDVATVASTHAPDADDWDRWNFDRTARLAERPRSAEYVPPAVAGIDDLDTYGDWRETPRYGHVWVPRDVPGDWAPYSTGRWVYDPAYEWTWVDDAPWGWAPYHYGRWCWVDGYWGWAPGPVIAAPVYAPALVAFFGGGGVSVGVAVGAPVVSWVALGWGEPLIPWWGPPAFVGHPYWGGWGGPRVVNNVVIDNRTFVNVRNINRFSNVDVRNAVHGAHRDQFGRGRGEHMRIPVEEARRSQPVRGQVGVRPTPQSLVPQTGRAQRPPDQIRNRRVVATRPPQDTSRRLHAVGIETRGAARPVEPRVVQPTRGREHPPAEVRGHERLAPPPPPGRERSGAEERGARERGPANANAPAGEGSGAGPEHGRHAAPPPGAERAPAAERGAPDVGHDRNAVPPPPEGRHGRERGADVERGRVAPPQPPGERPPATEHGVETERGRHTAPSGARGAGNEPDGAGAERGRHAAPPPPPTREPVNPRDGVDGRRGTSPPSVRESAPVEERGGAHHERRPESAPPAPRERQAPPERQAPREMPAPRQQTPREMPPPREVSPPREMPAPREIPAPREMPSSRGGHHESEPPPRPAREPAVERSAPREQPRPEPARPAAPEPAGRGRPTGKDDGRHDGHAPDPQQNR